MSATTRQVLPDPLDVRALAALVEQHASEAGAPPEPGFRRRFEREWHDHRGVAWLRLDEDVPLGFLTAEAGIPLPWPGAPRRRWLHLTGFFVLEGHRRRGHGAALLDSAARWASDHGMTRLTVTADDGIRAVYARAGFCGQPRSMTLTLPARWQPVASEPA